MYQCNCGEGFAGTLHGAWAAKLHAEDAGHRLRGGDRPAQPPRPPGLASRAPFR